MGSDARGVASYGSLLGLALVVVAAPAAAAQRGRPCGKAEPDLTLVWYDIFGDFREHFGSSSREVQEVFCRIGVDVAWRASEPSGLFATGASREVAVAVLRRYPRAREGVHVMGLVSAAVDPGLPRPVHVYLAGVEAALGPPPHPALKAGLLARAVGRVVAHELIHSLAPWQEHAAEGLMSASLGRDLLLGRLPDLAASHVQAVRFALDRGEGAQRRRLAAAPLPDAVLSAPDPGRPSPSQGAGVGGELAVR